MKDTARFAIVCTNAESALSINLFIHFHLAIGASKLFIFYEGTELECIKRHEDVILFKRDAALDRMYSYIELSKQTLFDTNFNVEVMARQCRNMAIATEYAKQHQIDWLIHIDGDELFYPNGNHLGEYFHELSAKQIGAMRFRNAEAIPVQDYSAHPFLERLKFKQNITQFWGYAQSRTLNDPLQNTPFYNNVKSYFNFYDNGKSAVNVNTEFEIPCVHGVIPKTHSTHNGTKKDPLILHFPCMTFEQFKEKYARLGDFKEYWYSDDLHVQSKAIVAQTSEQAQLAFYQANFLLTNENSNHLQENELLISPNTEPFFNKHITLAPPHTGYENADWGRKFCPPPSTSQNIIDLTKLTYDSSFHLTFGSQGEANRWVRRLNAKNKSDSYFVKTLNTQQYAVACQDYSPIDLSNAEKVQSFAEFLLYTNSMEGKSTVVLKGLHSLVSTQMEETSSAQLAHVQHRLVLKLCIALNACNLHPLCLHVQDPPLSSIPFFAHPSIVSLLLPTNGQQHQNK